MILTRNGFFLLLFTVILSPMIIYKLVWIAGTRQTTGNFYFLGHGNLGSVLGISTYPVIRFQIARDTFYFNGNVNIPLKENEAVPVRYTKSNPSDAKINVFSCVWGDSLAYELAPLLMLLVVFLHPDLVPKKARIQLGWKPWLRFV